MAGGDDGGRVDEVGLVHGRYLVLTGAVIRGVCFRCITTRLRIRSTCCRFAMLSVLRYQIVLIYRQIGQLHKF